MPCVNSAAELDALVAGFGMANGQLWLGYRYYSKYSRFAADNEWTWTAPGCASTYTNWAEGGLPPGSPGSSGSVGSGDCALASVAAKTWRAGSATSSAGVGATACACEVGPFAVSPAGALTATASLDRESLGAYKVPVTVTDDTQLSSTATVSVAVTNVVEAPYAKPGQVSFSRL